MQVFGADQCGAVGLEIFQFKTGFFHVMDLAHVVANARDLEPLRLRRDHAPASQIVQCGSPKHRFFAARIHCNIAADTRGLCRRRIHSKHKPSAFCRICDTLRHHARLRPNGRHVMVHPWQSAHLYLGHRLEFFRIDDCTLPS